MATTTRSALASAGAGAAAMAPREQEEAETNWAEEAAAASASASERPVASALDDANEGTRDDDDDDDDEEQDDDDDWVNDPFDDVEDVDDVDDVDANDVNDVYDDDHHHLNLHGIAAAAAAAADDDDDDDPHHNGEDEVLPNAFHDAANEARNHRRAPWILRVAIPNENRSDDDRERATASIYVDPGMTAERLGRCVVQAVSYSSSSSYSSSYSSSPGGAHYERDLFDYHDGPSFPARSGGSGSFWRGTNNNTYANTNATSSSIPIVGLFGNHDGVFYSLECILSMKPTDGERRVFCVQKPSPPLVAATPNQTDENETNDTNEGIDGRWGVAARVGALVALALWVSVLVSMSVSMSIWRDARHAIGHNTIHGGILHPWNDYLRSATASLLGMVPRDLPSAWKLLSLVLDWPAREVYRYGPSFVGWEGRDLVDICAQLHRKNYYFAVGYGVDYGVNYDYDPRNDREYWKQHLGACETVYRMKEESFVRLCRPLWYLGVMVATLWAISRLVRALVRAAFAFAFAPAPADDPSWRLDRTDRALLDTYRALKVLVREHAVQEGRYREELLQQQQQQQRERQRQRQR